MNISLAVRNYIDTAKQAILPVVLKFRDLRSDPDFFQKVAQVAVASIQLLIISSQKAAHLARFSFVLATANMHDFYRFLQYPQKLFFPVTVQSINQYVVVDDVCSFIEFKTKRFSPHDLKQAIEICLKDQLKQMAASGDAYRDVNQFQEVLQKRLHKDYPHLRDIHLSGLNEFIESQRKSLNWICPVSLLNRIISLNWAVVDFGCVALYLQGWKLLNTAKWAERIGQYSAFQWVKNTQLGTFVVGGVVTGFALQLVEAVRKLQKDSLTPQDRNRARWDMITSLAECALYGAIFLNQIGKTSINAIYLHYLAIASKSLGLMSIIIRPKPEFFQIPNRVI